MKKKNVKMIDLIEKICLDLGTTYIPHDIDDFRLLKEGELTKIVLKSDMLEGHTGEITDIEYKELTEMLKSELCKTSIDF